MGDSACFLGATCLSCGRFLGDGAPPTCPHCGADPGGGDGARVPIRRVNTILYCEQWAATVDFHRRVLGWRETFSNDWFVEFDLGRGASLSIADAARATIHSVGGQGMTLSIRVDDLAATRSRLEKRGAGVTAVARRFGSEVFDVVDPEGHRIEFWAE